MLAYVITHPKKGVYLGTIKDANVGIITETNIGGVIVRSMQQVESDLKFLVWSGEESLKNVETGMDYRSTISSAPVFLFEEEADEQIECVISKTLDIQEDYEQLSLVEIECESVSGATRQEIIEAGLMSWPI